MDVQQYAHIYKDNLLNDVIPFWEKYSPDPEYGGYFTCLDRVGNVFDTDKFTWLQARQIWTFSMLYNKVERKDAWLEMAIAGAVFLEAHGRDADGDWYFSCTRQGTPLVQAYNIFSDCFATMAFGQLYLATNIDKYRVIAVDTFNRILSRFEQPKGKYDKGVPGTRSLKGLSLPMILSNLVLEIEHVLPSSTVNQTINQCITMVMEEFHDPVSGLIMENIPPEGGFSDSFEGRAIMPGHSLESMWFLMDLAARKDDAGLLKKTVDISLNLLNYGWDTKYEGILYVMDIKGHPPQHLEWDQKLWWVHLEAIVAALKGFQYTGDQRCWEWFEKLHAYTWKHFPDPEFGEWFGYLNRRGEVNLSLKGGKWKGCFHVPRCLYQGWKTLEKIASAQPVVHSMINHG